MAALPAGASPAAVQQLLGMLQGSLSTDAGTRQAAEAALEAGAAAPGFGAALVAVLLTASGEVPLGLRQLAATVLKKLVREHWTPEAPQFKGPAVGEDEKGAMREALPAGLGDESSKVRTAAAMAVAAIARWDCPQAWPGLIPGLVQAITAKKNVNMGERGRRRLGGGWARAHRRRARRSAPGPAGRLPGRRRCVVA